MAMAAIPWETTCPVDINADGPTLPWRVSSQEAIETCDRCWSGAVPANCDERAEAASEARSFHQLPALTLWPNPFVEDCERLRTSIASPIGHSLKSIIHLLGAKFQVDMRSSPLTYGNRTALISADLSPSTLEPRSAPG